jgi:hypothetical protein
MQSIPACCELVTPKERFVEATNPRGSETSADVQEKLTAAQAELARAAKQRDYLLRLLRQQQTLSPRRKQYEAFIYYYEALFRFLDRHPVFRAALRIVPRPSQVKQFVKRLGIKTI